MKQQSHFGKKKQIRPIGLPWPPVDPGQRPDRGPGQKRICVFSHASEKLSMNLRLFIFIIHESCQILEIIHVSNKNKRKITRLQ